MHTASAARRPKHGRGSSCGVYCPSSAPPGLTVPRPPRTPQVSRRFVRTSMPSMGHGGHPAGGVASRRSGTHPHTTGGGVPGRGKVASSPARPTPAHVRQRLRRDLSLGQSASRAPSSRTRCTSSLHSVRPRRPQATHLENDRGSSRQVAAPRIPTGSPTSRARSRQDRRSGDGTQLRDVFDPAEP